MTATSRVPRTRPWPPTSRHGMISHSVAGDEPEVTLSITVRGDEAMAMLAPLVAAVRSIEATLGQPRLVAAPSARAVGPASQLPDYDDVPAEATPNEPIGSRPRRIDDAPSDPAGPDPAVSDPRHRLSGDPLYGDRSYSDRVFTDRVRVDQAPLHILTAEHQAMLDGKHLELPRREYDLLIFLATHPRRVFTRAELLRTVWGGGFEGGDRTVDVHVRRLRQKLESRGPSISTVRGVGYRLDDAHRVAVLADSHA